MDSLFDACADVVLSSSVLLAKAATDLPPKIGQYILYRACKEENDLAVQLLVENWSHPELSFDFFSNNRLCVRRELRSGCFWKPALYYGVFQEYTHQLEKNLPSILRGLFQHFYRRLSEGKPVLLQLVSLQALVIRNDNVEGLCKLLQGHFPTTHPADYLSERDSKALSKHRPQLPPLQRAMGRVELQVNIQLLSALRQERFLTSKTSGVFRLVLKGLYTNVQFVECLHPDDVQQLDYFFIVHGSCFSASRINSILTLVKPLKGLKCLGVPTDVGELIKRLAVSDHSAKGLYLNVSEKRADLSEDLLAVIDHHKQRLEYLQLNFNVVVPFKFEGLGFCQNLKVLSIYCGYTYLYSNIGTSKLFKTISQLPNLEFFYLHTDLNLQTHDVLSLHQTLCHSLPKLIHFHLDLGLFLLLSTTDLVNAECVPILPLLLKYLNGKEGDESCTTFRFFLNGEDFTHWLTALRPDVCFKISIFYR